MGFCLYGNDIDDTTSPLEAGLGWITKFTKEFTNSAALKAQKEQGLKRKLIGLEMLERGIPRHDYEVSSTDGKIIGKITSGTQSPTLQKPIAMAYLMTEYAAEGTEVNVIIRDKPVKAKVVKFPFLKKA